MRRLFPAVLGALLVTGILAGSPDACTNFCMDTPDGPVFGCTLDLFFPADGLVFVNRRGIAKEGFQANPSGETATWVSAYGSVTFNLAGREMAFGGMNEAGLVIGSMELKAGEFPEPDRRFPLTIGTWAQYVLDTCGDVREAIAADAVVRIEDSAPPIHFLIADALGNCAAIEWIDGETVCRTGADLPVKAMSNMPYERALQAYERGGPRWWWSNPGRSAERFAGAAERSRSYDPARDGSAVDYAFGTLIEVVGAPHTKWCIVYDIPRREIWYGSARSRAGKHISLRDFDFSCDAPLLTLDVNAPLEGEVREHFRPYDRAVNLELLLNLCARYELEVSREAGVSLLEVFEDYECAP